MSAETKTEESWEKFTVNTSRRTQKNKTTTEFQVHFNMLVIDGAFQLQLKENDGPKKMATFAALDKYKKEVIAALLLHYCEYGTYFFHALLMTFPKKNICLHCSSSYTNESSVVVNLVWFHWDCCS